MSWLKKIFSIDKNIILPNKCPSCGKNGYKTTLVLGKSYACKICKIWWVN